MSHSTRKTSLLLLGITLACGSSSSLLADHPEGPVIEVRVYKVAEGKMDEWERFFHDKLVEPQEKAGIKILSAYRTLEDENLFVWSRQFSSKANMPKERSCLLSKRPMEESPAPGTETKGTYRKSGDCLHGEAKQIITRWTADCGNCAILRHEPEPPR